MFKRFELRIIIRVIFMFLVLCLAAVTVIQAQYILPDHPGSRHRLAAG